MSVFGKRLGKSKGYTVTSEEEFPQGPAEDPITLVMRLPDGPVFDIEELAKRGIITHTVGREEGTVILEGDDRVSSAHCMLHYEDGNLCVTDSDSKNGTFVNNRRVGEDLYPVYPGNVIQLGKNSNTQLLVCGQARKDQPIDVVANSLPQFVTRLKEACGSWRKAAKRLGKSRQTLKNWGEGTE